MDIERRRALTRERVRRHRAVRAGVEKLIGKHFLPRISKVRQVDSSSDSTERKNIDSSDDESNDSAVKVSHSQGAMFDSCKIEADEQNDEQVENFDLDDIVSKLKSSPASSVDSKTSYVENQYAEASFNHQSMSSEVPSMTESRLPDPSTYESQETPWSSLPADSNVLRAILEGMQKIAYEQSKLTVAVNHMSSILERLTGDATPRKRETFEKTYNLELPFTTREDFLEFDTKLATDEDCRTAFVHSLYQKYDVKKAVTKNLTAIMRKFITREVALMYTAQKSVAGKGVFKDTTFSSCLLEMIDTLADDKLIGSVPDGEYFGYLGSVLSNAKDWGVTRRDRSGKRLRT